MTIVRTPSVLYHNGGNTMSEMKQIKNPAKYLLDTGLLFEINRQVLHPFGLSLGVVPSQDSDSEHGHFGLLLSGEDEGVVYGPESFIPSLEKLNAFIEQQGLAKINKRKEMLDFIVQTSPDPHLAVNGVPLVTYNDEYDETKKNSPNLITFVVPYKWLKDILKEMRDDKPIVDFLDEYTYDDAEHLYRRAHDEEVVISKTYLRDTV